MNFLSVAASEFVPSSALVSELTPDITMQSPAIAEHAEYALNSASQLCPYFLRGFCRDGSHCPFAHVNVPRGLSPPASYDFFAQFDLPAEQTFASGQLPANRGSVAALSFPQPHASSRFTIGTSAHHNASQPSASHCSPSHGTGAAARHKPVPFELDSDTAFPQLSLTDTCVAASTAAVVPEAPAADGNPYGARGSTTLEPAEERRFVHFVARRAYYWRLRACWCQVMALVWTRRLYQQLQARSLQRPAGQLQLREFSAATANFFRENTNWRTRLAQPSVAEMQLPPFV